MPFNKDVFVSNVQAIKNARGLKLGNIERAVGVSPGYLARLKSMGNSPSAELFVSVCEYLGVTAEEMIDPLYIKKKEAEIIDRQIEQLQKKKDELFKE